MICSAEPVLREDLHILQKEEFSITRYMCVVFTWQSAKHIHKRQTHPLVREDVAHNRKSLVTKKENSDRDSEGAWRQDELTVGKPPAVK
jgi:hypothetical protein